MLLLLQQNQSMNTNLNFIKEEIYDKCGLLISNFQTEKESQEYDACRFELNGLKIISRSAKVTPKKVGQFVTFWKRNTDKIIEPFKAADLIDFFIIAVKTEHRFGQFVFPKSILIKKGILSTDKKEGKRGFRVYPSWDQTTSKQAVKTQQWQLRYFYKIDEHTDFREVMELYSAHL
jgi:hypothetical protein